MQLANLQACLPRPLPASNQPSSNQTFWLNSDNDGKEGEGLLNKALNALHTKNFCVSNAAI